MPSIHLENVKLYRYSLNKKTDFYALNIHIVDGYYHFDMVTPDGIFSDLKLGFPGILNVENSVAAIGVASAAEPELEISSVTKLFGCKKKI